MGKSGLEYLFLIHRIEFEALFLVSEDSLRLYASWVANPLLVIVLQLYLYIFLFCYLRKSV